MLLEDLFAYHPRQPGISSDLRQQPSGPVLASHHQRRTLQDQVGNQRCLHRVSLGPKWEDSEVLFGIGCSSPMKDQTKTEALVTKGLQSVADLGQLNLSQNGHGENRRGKTPNLNTGRLQLTKVELSQALLMAGPE